MKQFVVFSLTIVVLFLATPIMWAQETCTPIYGGGENADGSPFCLEQASAQGQTSQVTPTTTQKSGFTTPNDGLIKSGQGTTKGGTTVQPAPSSVKSQPSTGPEMLGLVALLPAAAAGWALRRKTS